MLILWHYSLVEKHVVVENHYLIFYCSASTSFETLISNFKMNMLLFLCDIFQLIQTLKWHHNINCKFKEFFNRTFCSFRSSPELTVSFAFQTWCESAPISMRLGS